MHRHWGIRGRGRGWSGGECMRLGGSGEDSIAGVRSEEGRRSEIVYLSGDGGGGRNGGGTRCRLKKAVVRHSRGYRCDVRIRWMRWIRVRNVSRCASRRRGRPRSASTEGGRSAQQACNQGATIRDGRLCSGHGQFWLFSVTAHFRLCIAGLTRRRPESLCRANAPVEVVTYMPSSRLSSFSSSSCSDRRMC